MAKLTASNAATTDWRHMVWGAKKAKLDMLGDGIANEAEKRRKEVGLASTAPLFDRKKAR